MTCLDDISQGLLLATLVLVQQACGKNGGRNGGYTWAQWHGLPFTEAYLPTVTVKYPTCQQQRPMLGSQYGTIPLENLPATWWQVGPIPYTGPIHSYK